jgi:V/A-type H+-transporting ATPase subunit A
MIREDFLMQSAYTEVDAFSNLNKTSLMSKAIIEYYKRAREDIARGVSLEEIRGMPVKQKIARMKESSGTAEIESIIAEISRKTGIH